MISNQSNAQAAEEKAMIIIGHPLNAFSEPHSFKALEHKPTRAGRYGEKIKSIDTRWELSPMSVSLLDASLTKTKIIKIFAIL